MNRDPRYWRRSRRRIHIFQTYGKIGLVVGTVLVILFLTYPFIGEPKKQYVVKDDGGVEKISAGTEAGEVKKSLLESVSPDAKKENQDVVVGNEFARVGVLDYYPGGYHVVYPDGFVINYSPALFEARSPAGGKVVVNITGGQFNVATDLSGVSSDQRPIMEAASRLISGSFRFLSGPGYDQKTVDKRFSD